MRGIAHHKRDNIPFADAIFMQISGKDVCPLVQILISDNFIIKI